MPNVFSDLRDKLTRDNKISYLDLKPGDIVARSMGGVVSTFIYTTRVGDKATTAEGGELFLTGTGASLHLLHRPKPPLPSEPDARIVAWEIGHATFPEGVVLTRTHDYEESPWESLEEYHADSDIHEWALLPDNFFADLRKDSIK